jgi:hypothetical protein
MSKNTSKTIDIPVTLFDEPAPVVEDVVKEEPVIETADELTAGFLSPKEVAFGEADVSPSTAPPAIQVTYTVDPASGQGGQTPNYISVTTAPSDDVAQSFGCRDGAIIYRK